MKWIATLNVSTDRIKAQLGHLCYRLHRIWWCLFIVMLGIGLGIKIMGAFILFMFECLFSFKQLFRNVCACCDRVISLLVKMRIINHLYEQKHPPVWYKLLRIRSYHTVVGIIPYIITTPLEVLLSVGSRPTFIHYMLYIVLLQDALNVVLRRLLEPFDPKLPYWLTAGIGRRLSRRIDSRLLKTLDRFWTMFWRIIMQCICHVIRQCPLQIQCHNKIHLVLLSCFFFT